MVSPSPFTCIVRSLINAEALASLAHPFLAEEGGSVARCADRDDGHDQDGRRQDQEHARQNDVDHSLHPPPKRPKGGPFESHEGDPPHVVRRRARGCDAELEESGHDVDLYGQPIALPEHVDHPVLRRAVEGDDDAPDPLLANDTVEPIDGSHQRERQAIARTEAPEAPGRDRGWRRG